MISGTTLTAAPAHMSVTAVVSVFGGAEIIGASGFQARPLRDGASLMPL
jgi:hypothetical protein